MNRFLHDVALSSPKDPFSVRFCNIFKSEDTLNYQKTRDRHLNLIVSYCVLFLAPSHMISDSYLKKFSESRLSLIFVSHPYFIK